MSKKTLQMVVDHATKTVIPEDINLWNMAISDFQSGERVTVTIERFVRTRELSQSNLAHMYIKKIAEDTGHTMAETKSALKIKFGSRNEDGTIKSTAIYTTIEMAKFIDHLYEFGTVELGLIMPLPDDLKKKTIK